MYYSEIIWNLHYKERQTVPEIVAFMDNPLLNEKFVSTVIENYRWMRHIPQDSWRRKIERSPVHKKLRSMKTMRQQEGLHRRNRRNNDKKLW